MAGPASQVLVDRRIARFAAARHGVFTRGDATRAGATRGSIEWRVAARRWEVLYPGVYRLAGAPESWRQKLHAACLGAGAVAAASHRAAAAIASLSGFREGPVEISVPRNRRVRLRGIIVHEVTSLPRIDMGVIDAIPVTTVTRTLIDLAAVVPPDAIEEALDDALRRRLTTLRRLEDRLARLGSRGRPGLAAFRVLIEARAGTRAVIESPLETRFLRLLRRSSLPLPIPQFEIRDRGRLIARVDFAYPDHRLAIEVDGYRWHSGRARWEHDLRRRNELTSRGWRVLAVTATDVRDREDDIVRTIGDAISSR